MKSPEDKMPLVSVLVLSMNHADYVVKCLESIEEQTWPKLEVVYLDNNSKDRTFEIATEFLSQVKFPVRSMRNEMNRSISANFNRLVKNANGDYVCIISSDDWMSPENIELKMKKALASAETAVVYGNGYFFYEDTGKKEINPGYRYFKRGMVGKDLFRTNFVFTPGVLVKRSVLEEVGYYDETSPAEDYDMWLRISDDYAFDFIEEPTVFYRRHSSNASGNIQFMYDNYAFLLQKYKNHKHAGELERYMQHAMLNNIATTTNSFRSFMKVVRSFQFRTYYFKSVIKALLTWTGVLKNQ